MTPANVTLREVRPNDGEQPRETTRRSRRRRNIVIGLAMAWLMMAALACVLLLSGTKSSTPLGDTAAVPGGLARISAIIPLESDGWVPPRAGNLLAGPVQPGSHRVRIVLELSAPEAAGLVFRAADYSLSGLESLSTALWVDPAVQNAAAGTSIRATLVFEIPNQAIALVLDGPEGARLALGTEHHTGP